MSWLELLLGNAVLASGLALLAVASSRLRGSPRAQHALWVLVYLALVSPPVLGWQVAVSRLAGPISALVPSMALAPLAGQLGLTLSDWLLRLWGFAAGCALLVLCLRIWRLSGLLATGRKAPPWLIAEARAVAHEIGLTRSVPIRVVPASISPSVFGLGPWVIILLPARLVEEFPRDGCRLVLAHELGHVQRRDPWVRGLELACGIVFGWFPLVWMARRRLRMLEELCCDALVMERFPGQRRAYANALLDTLDLVAPAPARCFSPAARELRTRILALRTGAPARGSGPGRRLAVLGVAIALPFAPRPTLERWTVIQAHDPAGAFTIAFAGSNVASVAVDGTPWPRELWRQERGRLHAWRPDGSTELQLDLEPGGRGFRWEARPLRGSPAENP